MTRQRYEDWQLLPQWVEHRSEAAFTQLVDRHIDFVHNCARRQVGDPVLAQDVTQAVFLLLSRKAGSFRENMILTSWLFRTTRFIAATLHSHLEGALRQRTQHSLVGTRTVSRHCFGERGWTP